MSNKQHLSTWVSRETKGQFAEIARLQGKSESALLKSRVQAMLVTAAPPTDPTPVPESAPSRRLSVRLRDDDFPLPDAELQAFKSAIGEVKAVGRSRNQIARATYAGRVTGGAAVEDLRALLTVCTKLWELMKRVVSVNLESWESGHDQARR